MANFFIVLFQQNPWLVYPLLVGSCGVIPLFGVLVVIALIQGRQLQLGWITIGPKQSDTLKTPPPVTQTVTQNPIQTVHVHTDSINFSQDQIKVFAAEVAARVQTIQAAENKKIEDTQIDVPDGFADLGFVMAAVYLSKRVMAEILVLDQGQHFSYVLGNDEELFTKIEANHLIDQNILRDVRRMSYWAEHEEYYLDPLDYPESISETKLLAIHTLEKLSSLLARHQKNLVYPYRSNSSFR